MRTSKSAQATVLFFVVGISALDHLGWLTGPSSDDRSRYHNVECTVTYVADGDTFDVDIPDGGKSVTRIRLWGVDCPEIAHGDDEAGAFFGDIAKDFVLEHVEGRRVRLGLDPNKEPRDRYGRLLAFVYFVDSDEMLNDVLVHEGLAYADRRFGHAFKLQFQTSEKRAARAKRGLWKDVTVEQMPAWRQWMLKAGAIR